MIHTHFATALLVALLAAAAAIDMRTMRIPNVLNAVIGISGLAVTWALQRSLMDALIGVAVGYAALVFVNWAYRAARGRDGLGLGDAKLLAGAGAWIGWAGLPFVVLIASALGLVYVAALRVAGRTLPRDHALPFGPFLCAGILIVWIVLVYAQR